MQIVFFEFHLLLFPPLPFSSQLSLWVCRDQMRTCRSPCGRSGQPKEANHHRLGGGFCDRLGCPHRGVRLNTVGIGAPAAEFESSLCVPGHLLYVEQSMM